jgi:hypothetical protein
MQKRRTLVFMALWLLCGALPAQAATPQAPQVTRLADGPIIVPNMDSRMGSNIQGPSLIRVPPWIDNPLGNYYLYFADHRGSYIRLAYADDITGPWSIYEEGSLRLEDSFFPTTCPPCSLALGTSAPLYAHIASPDVHVDNEKQQIVMYIHGRDAGRQLTRLATSKNGIDFEGRPDVLGRPYFRVIEHGAYHYALSMPGYLYRSRDGMSDFQEGPRFFNDNMRHNALLIRDNTLHVFWTQAGHAPERIFLSTIDMEGDWMQWQESEPVEVLRPQMVWEGAELEIAPSRRGHIDERVNQLRDPTIFEEDGRLYLLYSIAGEHGIAVAELEFE